MSFMSIDDVQREVDQIGEAEFAARRAGRVYGEDNQRMIRAWESDRRDKAEAARADREERATRAAEDSAASAKDSADAARDSAKWARWAVIVAVAALTVAAWPYFPW